MALMQVFCNPRGSPQYGAAENSKILGVADLAPVLGASKAKLSTSADSEYGGVLLLCASGALSF